MTAQQDLNETLGRAVTLLNALDDKRAEQIATLEAKVAALSDELLALYQRTGAGAPPSFVPMERL